MSASRDGVALVWDLQSGEIVKSLPNTGDITDLAAGPRAIQFLVINGPDETWIADLPSSKTIASFPVRFNCRASHPFGHLWAGAKGRHLYMIKLEGGDR